MTEPNKEMKMRLSLLLDGELQARDNPRLLDKIATDAELKAVWGRYHLIGDVMRAAGRHGAVDQDFAARVSAAVRAEPTALAPRRSGKAPSDLRSRIAHFALAASLAAIAVIVGKSLSDGGSISAPQAVAQAPAEQPPTPQAVESTAEARFNDYLLMHNETAYLAGSAGMLPYARLVGSGSDH
jgi:sigma-E factor negative regulatory protein RseA